MIQDSHDSLQPRKSHKINLILVKRTEKRKTNGKNQTHSHDNSKAILITVIQCHTITKKEDELLMEPLIKFFSEHQH